MPHIKFFKSTFSRSLTFVVCGLSSPSLPPPIHTTTIAMGGINLRLNPSWPSEKNIEEGGMLSWSEGWGEVEQWLERRRKKER